MKLRELISTQPSVISQNLGNLVERCSELFADRDGINRTAILRILKTLFPKVSVNMITPFFPVLNAHLCCALTNIDEAIQIDSLRFLDVILDYYPDLIAANSSQLIQSIPAQLSKLTAGAFESEKKKVITPTVVDPSGKLGRKKWQFEILEKFHHILEQARDNETHKYSNNARNVVDVKWKPDLCGMQLYSHPIWNTAKYRIGYDTHHE